MNQKERERAIRTINKLLQGADEIILKAVYLILARNK